MKKILLMASTFFMLLFMSSCNNTTKQSENIIRIASSYGMSYSPLEVMLKMNLIEKIAPDIKIEMVTLTGSAAINEAVIAGDIDVAGIGVTTFLIGHDKGVPYKIVRALADIELAMQTNDPTIKSLNDIRPEHRIAVNSIVSTHNILLTIVAERDFNDASKFEDQVIVMNHPDATMALMSGVGLDLHFTSQPYIFMQNKNNFPTILSERDVMGDDGFTSVVVAATNSFLENRPELFNVFMQALNEAIILINNRDPEAISIIAASENISEEEVIALLDSNKVSYDAEILNMLRYSEYMYKLGYISNVIESMDELLFKE